MSAAQRWCSRWRCAWLVGTLLAFAFDSSAAAADAHVVIVAGSESDPVVDRLVPELRSSGFVVQVQPDLGAGPPSLDANAADAVLRVTAETTVELWIVDPIAHRAILVETLDIAPPRSVSAGAVALRLVEMLRARLLSPPSTPAPAPGAATAAAPTPLPAQVSDPPPTQPAPSFRPARVGLDAGALVLFSAGGSPPALDVLLAARWMPWSALVLRALVSLPVVSPQLTAPEGSASVSAGLAGANVDWRLTSEANPWGASVGAGLAAAWVRTNGTANPPSVGSTGDGVTAVPFLEARAARALGTPRARLGLEGMLGASLPEVAIYFAGREAGSWGRPLGALAVVVELDAF